MKKLENPCGANAMEILWYLQKACRWKQESNDQLCLALDLMHAYKMIHICSTIGEDQQRVLCNCNLFNRDSIVRH